MFDFLKKNKNKSDLHAIVNGEVVELSTVNDPVFAEKMMGDGFAMKPEDGTVYSPVNATVKMVAPTKHAIGLIMENGIEILLHLGIDTVELEGKPFEVHVTEGQTVTSDTPLITMDLNQLKEADKDNTIMVIFTKADKVKAFNVDYKQANVHDVIGQVEAAK